MGRKVFQNDLVTKNVAIFEEPVATGSYGDPASARNAPLRNPEQNLPWVYFHTGMDQMEVAFYQPSIPIAHAKVAGRTPAEIDGVANTSVTPGVDRVDKLLLKHNLGYVPHFLAAVGNVILTPGYPVQVLAGGGRARFVTAYATDTEIRLSEISMANDTDMPAVTVTYRVMVFRAPSSASGIVGIDYNPTTGVAAIGYGRFRSDRSYLQVMPQGSGTPFALPNGPTIDIKNGAPVFAKADGTLVKPMPDLKYSMVEGRPFGNAMQYNGSFAPPPTIPVQAP